MGCCEYKNLGRKYSEVGELSRADSFSKVSEKYNGHDSTYFIEPNKEPSSLSIKLQKIPLETKNYEQINGNKYNENFDFNNKKELPPLIPLNAIGKNKKNCKNMADFLLYRKFTHKKCKNGKTQNVVSITTFTREIQ